MRQYSFIHLFLILALASCASIDSRIKDLPVKGQIEIALQQTDLEIIAVAKSLKELKDIGVIEKDSSLDNQIRDKLLESSDIMNSAWGYFETGLLDKAQDRHKFARTILIELRKIANERKRP